MLTVLLVYLNLKFRLASRAYSIAVRRRIGSAFYYSRLKFIKAMKAPEVDISPLEFQIQPILVYATFLAVLAVLIWIIEFPQLSVEFPYAYKSGPVV